MTAATAFQMDFRVTMVARLEILLDRLLEHSCGYSATEGPAFPDLPAAMSGELIRLKPRRGKSRTP